MDSYPGVRSDSVMGFMPRSAALEHLHRFVCRGWAGGAFPYIRSEGLWAKQPRAGPLATQQESYPLNAGEVVKSLSRNCLRISLREGFLLGLDTQTDRPADWRQSI